MERSTSSGPAPAPAEAPPSVTLADVQEAAVTLEGVANRTPVVTSRTLDEKADRRVFLKCESFQRGGAFKFRGAYNRISRLSREEARRGVVAFSSGNHAQGVALAARLLGVPATIVMPSDAPSVKLAATRVYGAEVLPYDRATQDREEIGRRLARDRGLTLVPPYDDPAVIAGQGTTALELVSELPDLEALVVPVSGGGLIAGCATAARGLSPGLRVFGVEPADGNDTQLSLAAGERVTIPPPATIADGLRVPTPGRLTFPIVQRLVEAVVTVSEAEIREALRFLLLRMKLAVEPSGAVGVAAVLAGRIPGGRVGVVVSGGNIDPALLAELWAAEAAGAPANPEGKS